MRKYSLILIGLFIFNSCSEDESDKPELMAPTLELVSDKQHGNVLFDDATFIFTVTDDGQNVTSFVKIYVNNMEINGNTFIAETEGTYYVIAKKGNEISNEISIQVDHTAKFGHKVILEDFTQVICPGCPFAVNGINNLMSITDQVIPITIHVHYSPIQFVIPESAALFFDYLHFTGLPTLYVNRTAKWLYPFDESVENYPLNFAKPNSDIGISINSNFNENEKTIQVKFAFSEIPSTQYYYTIMILENHLIYPQSNGSDLFGGQNPIPDFEHNHVLRGFTTTDITGDVLPMGNMQDNVVTINVQNPYIYEYENMDNLEIIAYIMDEDGKILTGQRAPVNTLQKFEFIY